MFKKIFSAFCLLLVVVPVLSACGETAPLPETETEREEVEILVEEMPEIVFVRATQIIEEGISGNFITRNGEIYLWDFGEINFKRIDELDNYVYEQLLDALNNGPEKSQVEIDERDLLDMYSKLMRVDISAEVNSWNNPIDLYMTYQYIYYGIRHNKSGGIEIILLGGDGMDIYENTDPNANEIYQWRTNRTN